MFNLIEIKRIKCMQVVAQQRFFIIWSHLWSRSSHRNQSVALTWFSLATFVHLQEKFGMLFGYPVLVRAQVPGCSCNWGLRCVDQIKLSCHQSIQNTQQFFGKRQLFTCWVGHVCVSVRAGKRFWNPGPGCSKPDWANPGLARNLISFLWLFSKEFRLHFFPFGYKNE